VASTSLAACKRFFHAKKKDITRLLRWLRTPVPSHPSAKYRTRVISTPDVTRALWLSWKLKEPLNPMEAFESRQHFRIVRSALQSVAHDGRSYRQTLAGWYSVGQATSKLFDSIATSFVKPMKIFSIEHS
jgi:hypothetical protein